MALAANLRSDQQRTALYRFFDKKDRLLYVGITDRLGERWSTHMRTKPWWSKVHRQTAEWHNTRKAAAAAEIAAIQDEKPLYNVAHAAKPDPPSSTLPKFLILTINTGRATRSARLNVSIDGATAQARDLLEDIAAVMGDERIRLADLPARLRGLAPRWEPYQGLTGIQLAAMLRKVEVRITRAGNVPRLAPEDLHKARTAA